MVRSRRVDLAKSDMDRVGWGRERIADVPTLEAGDGSGLGGMKSGRLRELGWDTGYDAGCAFWSTP